LLKNDRQILPLKKSGTIALIGPLAENQKDLLGTWHGAGDWQNVITVAAGITNVAGPAVKILYAKGANLLDDTAQRELLQKFGADIPVDARSPKDLLTQAVAVANQADVVVAVLGESSTMSGEAAAAVRSACPNARKTCCAPWRKPTSRSCWWL
jgi:beta-glucosidase